MKKDKYGVWEITVASQDGTPAIPHDSIVKVNKCNPQASPIEHYYNGF